MNKAEQQFASKLDSLGFTWKFEPCAFDIGYKCPKQDRNVTYTPDFYCHETNTHYEVSANRQAYHQSMKKTRRLVKVRPDINIKIVNPDGTAYKSRPEINKRLSCFRCDHEWVPRVEVVRVCPRCMSPYWNQKRRKRRG